MKPFEKMSPAERINYMANQSSSLNRFWVTACDANRVVIVNQYIDVATWDDAAQWANEMIEPCNHGSIVITLHSRGANAPYVSESAPVVAAHGEPMTLMTLAGRINRECLDWLEIPDTDGELMLVAMPHGVVTMFADMNGYATPEECYSAAPHLHRIVAPSWNAYVVNLAKRAAPECVAFLADVPQESNRAIMARAVAFVRDVRRTAEYLAAHDDEPATLDDGMSSDEQVRALAHEQARADAARKLSGVVKA